MNTLASSNLLLETKSIIVSWTLLESWYSSTKTSSKNSMKCSATLEGTILLFSSLSINIFKQRCSKSLKSNIFFSLFFSLNLLENSSVTDAKVFIKGYTPIIPSNASWGVNSNVLSIKALIFFFTESLILLTEFWAFSSETWFFFTVFNLIKVIEFNAVYILFKFSSKLTYALSK